MKIKMKNRSHRYDINRLGLDMDTHVVNIKVSQYDDAYMHWATPKQCMKLNSCKS